jgi:formylglycine-generating enzyme required for sulfatase activity
MSYFSLMKQVAPCIFPWFVAAAISLSAPAQAGEITNKIGITMVDIPGGSFLMGSCMITDAMQEENKKRAFIGQALLTANCTNSDSDAKNWETPQHRVTIRAFQMSKTEVTLGQFKQFIAATGRTYLVNDEFIKWNAYGDDAPVVNVSWHDAQTFIGWLNKVAGGGYRLPSEAEWEYACRAGDSHTYCGSNNIDAVAWSEENSGHRPHSVGSKQANAFGLCDMSGNVWEWVQDCVHSNYRGAPADGSAWTRGKCEKDSRWLRGGSWNALHWSNRAAARASASPDTRSNDNGFRLVRTR